MLWYQRRIKTTTKLRLFKAIVLLTLLYGSESWTPLSIHMNRLQGFVMRCLRIILGISVREKRRHTELREVDTLLRYRRLRWLGHVARMGHWHIPRNLLVCKPDGGRWAAGDQKLRWNDVVLKDLKVCGIQDSWFELAQDHDSITSGQ